MEFSVPSLSRRSWTVLGAVAAVLLVLLGYAVGALTARPGAPGDTSADAGFARDMSAHHAQAVEMGMIAYQNATVPDVITLGGDIAITQQGQIGIMQTWLKGWGLNANSAQPPMAWIPGGEQSLRGNLMPGMATRDEIGKLRAATGREVDILFCQLMLRHHQGGIHMVEELLKLQPSGEVAELAQTMKANQSNEVAVLQTLLSQLGAQPLP